jgi:hypothetical protein
MSSRPERRDRENSVRRGLGSGRRWGQVMGLGDPVGSAATVLAACQAIYLIVCFEQLLK